VKKWRFLGTCLLRGVGLSETVIFPKTATRLQDEKEQRKKKMARTAEDKKKATAAAAAAAKSKSTKKGGVSKATTEVKTRAPTHWSRATQSVRKVHRAQKADKAVTRLAVFKRVTAQLLREVAEENATAGMPRHEYYLSRDSVLMLSDYFEHGILKPIIEDAVHLLRRRSGNLGRVKKAGGSTAPVRGRKPPTVPQLTAHDLYAALTLPSQTTWVHDMFPNPADVIAPGGGKLNATTTTTTTA
jgi:hypothetical protein